MENHRKLGAAGEEVAKQYLLSKGYRIITQNYGIGRGEIDLIAQDLNDEIVFVEVKFTRTARFGAASAKVTPEKMTTIRRVAEHFLVTHKLQGAPCRVDVVAIEAEEITHLQNCVLLDIGHGIRR